MISATKGKEKVVLMVDLLLWGICILMLISVFAFYKWQVWAANANEWLRSKKATAIGCGAEKQVLGANSLWIAHNDQRPEGDGNGCSHQSAVGALCSTRGLKAVTKKIVLLGTYSNVHVVAPDLF